MRAQFQDIKATHIVELRLSIVVEVLMIWIEPPHSAGQILSYDLILYRYVHKLVWFLICAYVLFRSAFVTIFLISKVYCNQ